MGAIGIGGCAIPARRESGFDSPGPLGGGPADRIWKNPVRKIIRRPRSGIRCLPGHRRRISRRGIRPERPDRMTTSAIPTTAAFPGPGLPENCIAGTDWKLWMNGWPGIAGTAERAGPSTAAGPGKPSRLRPARTLSFLDAQTGWSASPYQLQSTGDGGATWRTMASPAEAGNIAAIALRSEERRVCAGRRRKPLYNARRGDELGRTFAGIEKR